MRRKVSLLLAMVILLTCLGALPKGAQEVLANEFMFADEYVLFDKAVMLEDIDTISIKSSLIMDGQKNYLYPTFDDNEHALNNVRIKAKNILVELEEKNHAGVLSEENWETYYNTLNELQETGFVDEKKLLLAFFDMFKQQYVNEDIVNCVNSNMDSEEKRASLYYLLPYTTPFVEAITEQRNNGIALYSYFDTQEAIRYARSHSTNPNTYDYDYFSADCTNFVSQIMEAGGISQDDNLQYPWVGWWHEKDGNAHYHSRSWTVANDFARYFGIDYSNSSHFRFSANVEPGVVILIDSHSDGSWDHAGFVVDADNYLTDGYYDYFVAQHTRNYLAWTSTSENGWEFEEGYGSTYGIIIP